MCAHIHIYVSKSKTTENNFWLQNSRITFKARSFMTTGKYLYFHGHHWVTENNQNYPGGNNHFLLIGTVKNFHLILTTAMLGCWVGWVPETFLIVTGWWLLTISLSPSRCKCEWGRSHTSLSLWLFWPPLTVLFCLRTKLHIPWQQLYLEMIEVFRTKPVLKSLTCQWI